MGLFRRKQVRNSPEVCAAVMEAIGGKEGAIREMNRIFGSGSGSRVDAMQRYGRPENT